MAPDIFEHVLYQLFNSNLNEYPFEHLYVKEIFTKEFYQQILLNLPDTENYKRIDQLGKVSPGSYQQRFIFPLESDFLATLPSGKGHFWENFLQMFGGKSFLDAVTTFFYESVQERFAGSRTKPELKWEIALVRDTTSYQIGPHTDIPGKLISLLFYLPSDDSLSGMGTSLFAPKEKGYFDPLGRHHHFDDFKLIKTMPYKPNTMFGFFRTDTSWHGVLPLQGEEIERNSISFQIIITNLQDL